MGEPLRIEKWAENLEEVTMGRWLKREGEVVASGEPLCEIITEKVTFEYEAPVSGVLRRIYAPEKSVVPVGYVFAFIGDAAEPLPAEIEVENQRLLERRRAELRLQLDWPSVHAGAAEGEARVRAVPAARRLARQHGISLAEVAAWLGTQRPVTEEDVRRFLAEHSKPD
jgi:pyruvate dehydrogenase E2 component (dihydrolipoamide acetyltransferase)